jgi:hypothetical protein
MKKRSPHDLSPQDASRYRATYDELISTGTIRLITNDQLLETATAMYTTPAFDQLTEQAMGAEYRRLFRETVPAGIQDVLSTHCGDRYAPELDHASIEGSIGYPCILDLPAENVLVAASGLKAVPRFVPALRVRFADNQTALADLQLANDGLLKILRAIRDKNP